MDSQKLLTTLQEGVYSCARQHAAWNSKSFACAATAVRCQLSLTAVRSPAVHSQPQAGISDAKFQMPVSTTQGKQAVSRDASSSSRQETMHNSVIVLHLLAEPFPHPLNMIKGNRGTCALRHIVYCYGGHLRPSHWLVWQCVVSRCSKVASEEP